MIRVAGAALVDDGRVLLAQRPEGHWLALKWEFPGGKVEPDETDEAALRRELREELGVEARIGEAVCTSLDATGPVAIELVVHLGIIESGDITPFEHREVRWVPVAKLLDFDLAPADIPAAMAIRDRLA